MEWFKDKNKRAGIIGTVVFHLLLAFILLLYSLTPPFPPPPQLGVEVNLGNSDNGMGEVQPEKSQQVSKTVPQTAKKVDNVATQNTEETINLNNTKKPKPKVEPKPEEKPQEKKVDQRFMFKKTSKGGSEGKTGKPGDQGMEHGDPNASNYAGDGGSGGVTFNLAGRKKKFLPKPSNSFKEEGKVVVKIWVNKYGKVVNAVVTNNGTTTTSAKLRRLAVEAAKKAEFDSKPDAPEVQTGTITYVFIVGNG